MAINGKYRRMSFANIESSIADAEYRKQIMRVEKTPKHAPIVQPNKRTVSKTRNIRNAGRPGTKRKTIKIQRRRI